MKRIGTRAIGIVTAICVITSITGPGIVQAQLKEDVTVRESIIVLNEIMNIPANAIPAHMLRDAHAVAIIPKVIKGSFVIGARHGHGVLMVRDPNGGWHAPVFINLTGGNIGWQVGVQSTDVVLVFRTQESVSSLLSGKFTLGADAAVAAGPIGRQASAATDSELGAAIYSWSRSRGLFLGVSIDGSVIELDPISIANYYRPATAGGPAVVPDAAQQLATQVTQYTGIQTQAQIAVQNASNMAAQQQLQQQQQFVQQFSQNTTDHVRDELGRFARQLFNKLDTNWQSYLALPAEVFSGNGHPQLQVVNESLERFERIRTDATYTALANDAAFQSTYGLLKNYSQLLSNAGQSLELPAPPTDR